MAFNVWAPQGQLSGLTTQSNPNVIYEAGAKVLSGTVFKMWCTKNNGFGDLNYYESLDGLTSWTAHPSNPIGSGTGFNFPTVYHIGSTYYCYSGPENDQIYVRTSADGITWGSATSAITRGTAGAWDDTDIAQLNIVTPTPVGGLYYGYYEGIHTSSSEGLVTSPDLITWTKSGANPILVGLAPGTSLYINGIYYFWTPAAGASAITGALGYSGLARLSASIPGGPWTFLNNPGNTIHQAVNYPTLAADVMRDTSHICSMGDPYILSALGNMYMYWTKTDREVSNQFGINASIATGVTPLQLVSGYEGVIGFPLPGPDGFNLNALASDNFTRANANPIGGNWTPIGTSGGFVANQIVSNFVESTVDGSNAESFYNAVSFPNDMWSKVTLQTVNGNATAFAGPSVRMNASKNEYRMQWQGGGTPGLGHAGQLTILPVVAGAGGTSQVLLAITASQNDTLMLVVSGQNILGYLNGFPCIALATAAGLTTGSSGLTTVTTSGTVGDAQISAWSGGGFIAAPTFSPLGGTGNAGSLSLRRRKRRDVIS